MNKKAIAIGLSVVAFGVAHAAFWVYQSGKIKESIGQLTTQIAKGAGGNDSEFFYSSSSVSGYPLSFKVSVHEPKYTGLYKGRKVEVSSAEQPLVIASNLIGSAFKIQLPTKINIKAFDASAEKLYALEFNKESPDLEVRFSGNIASGVKDVSGVIPYLGEKMKSVHYADSGYVVTSGDGAKIAIADLNEVYAVKNISKDGSIVYKYNVKLQNVDNSALFEEEERKLQGGAVQMKVWPLNANIEFITTEARDSEGRSQSVDMDLKDVSVSNPSFGLALSGTFKANAEDVFPFGDINLKLTNYANVVDYFGSMLIYAFAESKIPLLQLNAGKQVNFKKVLFEIASEKSNEDKDILIKFQREQGKNLFIGQKGLMEVVDMIKTSASEHSAEEIRKDGASVLPNQATQKPVDVAPAAGVPASDGEEAKTN